MWWPVCATHWRLRRKPCWRRTGSTHGRYRSAFVRIFRSSRNWWRGARWTPWPLRQPSRRRWRGAHPSPAGPRRTLAPELVARRALDAMAAPATVSASLAGGALILRGAAPHAWIVRAGGAVRELTLAGV